MTLKRLEERRRRLERKEEKALEQWEREVHHEFRLLRGFLNARPFTEATRQDIINALGRLQNLYREIEVLPEAYVSATGVVRRVGVLIHAIRKGVADTPARIADEIVMTFQLRTTIQQAVEKNVDVLKRLANEGA